MIIKIRDHGQPPISLNRPSVMSENVVLKKNPYTLARFETIQQGGWAYVDKTRYIEVLENCHAFYPFIVRPRRFGKTLFAETLQAYYDVAAAKDFDKNFAGTYIGAHKTPLANAYNVIRFDFSGISSDQFEAGFLENLKDGFNDFCLRRNFEEGFKLIENASSHPTDFLKDFLRAYSKRFSERIYLIIDEYDQGANEVLASSVEDFRALTKSGGLLKTFYSILKAKATSSGPIAWIFITGVTSIQLDSMTSGFSIAKNFTNSPKFSGMFGFSEAELRGLIPQLVDLKQYGKTLDEVIARMKEWYNGYHFSADSDESVFNASMCLYYLDVIADTGHEPRSMLDPSVANSLDKIESILSLGDAKFVRSVMEKALQQEPIPFGGELQVLNLNQRNGFDEESILSALYYMGFLTFAPGDSGHLIVPNRAIGIQFFEYFFKHILKAPKFRFNHGEFARAYEALAAGDPKPWLGLSNKRLVEDSGVHMHAQLTEKVFQTMLSATLWFSTDYRGQLEYESRGEDAGFMDLLLTPRENKALPTYVIEVKHLAVGAEDAAVATALEAARQQAIRYAKGEALCNVSNLKRVAIVYKGLKIGAVDVA